MNAFMTGSHIYGTPTEDSDVDLVIFMEPGAGFDFANLFKAEIQRGKNNYPGAQFTQGKLNIILCTDEEQYFIWEQGTRELWARRPVTREEAMAHFAQLRVKYGAAVEAANTTRIQTNEDGV